MPEPNAALIWAIAAVFAALTLGTLVRMVALRGATEELIQSRFESLKTWWSLAGILAIAVLTEEIGIALLLTAVAGLSLKEYIRLVGVSELGSHSIAVIYLLVAFYYLALLLGQQELMRQAAPVLFVVVCGGVRASLGVVEGYIRTTAAMVWGLMLFVFALSHAWLLLKLPFATEPLVGRLGWFLFLILLTETNDIMQAITGRRFGKTKITPKVSPNKSLEGLVGGLLTTTLLAMITAPWLTCLTLNRSLAAGIGISAVAGALISIFGFLGDINMSAIKRDAGVKDGSRLLPGQGGMIDRIDSLTFTAPVFYYFVRLVV